MQKNGRTDALEMEKDRVATQQVYNKETDEHFDDGMKVEATSVPATSFGSSPGTGSCHRCKGL